ncbi:hypothetical protein FHR87_003934 [Azomonas macrocytogenes]|uniref:Helix-turn-helix domain-containing protein n=5 Tax=Pseudomonadaceae TaxID=135621 RepID=A0A839T7Q2_AZOMA|nr:hypothetical protein [Azomonas macrocytogenes]
MVNPHHLAHWYPTAAYLYVFWLDALALAWEYLRRHPDYRLDWLRRHRRREAAHRWGLRLLEDPALDARDAHPAWLPGHAAVVQLYPDADPPVDAESFAFWRIPGQKQLFHDGKKLALIARSPRHCLRFALAAGLEDGMAVAYAHRGGAAAPARGHVFGAALADARRRPTPAAQPQRYLTNDEAAEYLRLSPRTLEKQRVIGGGPRFRKFGRRVMYAVADLDAWAADRSFETTSDPEYAEHHSADSRAR